MHQTTLSLSVEDSSHAGEARRTASALAQRLGMKETDVGRLAIVVTELARNIALHARRGLLLLTPLVAGPRAGIRILALDKGPGMADVDRCLRDGYSTTGTPGTGMGAIMRLSDSFDIYSLPGQGTAILSFVWSGSAQSSLSGGSGLIVDAVSVPVRGEEVCGDGWAARVDGEPWQIMVVDGLGHGPYAADAAREMVAVFEAERGRNPALIMERAHAALRATRGAAVSIAELDPTARQVRYVGVGNIMGAIHVPGGKGVNMVSHNGTIGLEASRIREFLYGWPPGALFVMHSDGLSSHWSFDAYPGLTTRHPGLIAAVFYRDFRRERDDATVLVAREKDCWHEPAYSQH